MNKVKLNDVNIEQMHLNLGLANIRISTDYYAPKYSLSVTSCRFPVFIDLDDANAGRVLWVLSDGFPTL